MPRWIFSSNIVQLLGASLKALFDSPWMAIQKSIQKTVAKEAGYRAE
jgi:hypothetical protein